MSERPECPKDLNVRGLVCPGTCMSERPGSPKGLDVRGLERPGTWMSERPGCPGTWMSGDLDVRDLSVRKLSVRELNVCESKSTTVLHPSLTCYFASTSLIARTVNMLVFHQFSWLALAALQSRRAFYSSPSCRPNKES